MPPTFLPVEINSSILEILEMQNCFPKVKIEFSAEF